MLGHDSTVYSVAEQLGKMQSLLLLKKEEAATLEWLTEQGTQNIRQLNEVIRETAVSWHERSSTASPIEQFTLQS